MSCAADGVLGEFEENRWWSETAYLALARCSRRVALLRLLWMG